jgi:hypothetical protein
MDGDGCVKAWFLLLNRLGVRICSQVYLAGCCKTVDLSKFTASYLNKAEFIRDNVVLVPVFSIQRSSVLTVQVRRWRALQRAAQPA